MRLERGLNVLLKVSANFHAQYGFSLNISDIDPTYTLGDLAKQYQVILTRLHEEGLLELNKSLPAPFDIQHVLVIAPEQAAGLGDFRADADNLAATGACQFYYEAATFQGNHAPDEIRQALIRGIKNLSAQGITPDIIVIIRGGGAVGDLAYLNDYELAALVAEQPIPVWVGIGHERDRVMLDEVAQQSFDTPSKVIAAIRHQLVTLTQTAQQIRMVQQNIEQYANMLQNTAQLPANLIGELQGNLTRLASLSGNLKTLRGDIVGLGQVFNSLFPEQSLFGELAGASPQQVEAANAKYQQKWDKWSETVDQASQATFQLSGSQLDDLQKDAGKFQAYLNELLSTPDGQQKAIMAGNQLSALQVQEARLVLENAYTSAQQARVVAVPGIPDRGVVGARPGQQQPHVQALAGGPA